MLGERRRIPLLSQLTDAWSPAGLLVALLAALQAGCATAPDHHIEWLHEHAQPLSGSALDPLPPEVQNLVAAAASTHRYIALAEGDHYIADKYDYRLAFLRDLVLEGGVRQIAMEIGGSDARRIDRFLETGDESFLDKVVLYGYVGDDELERRELGPYAQAPENLCTTRFVAAERRFWRELHGLSTAALAVDGRRIHLYGFDFDAKPGGGFRDARDALEVCEEAPIVATTRAALTPPSGSSGMAEVDRLRQLIVELRGERELLDGSCGAGVAEQIALTLDQLASSYALAMERASTGEDSDALRVHFDEREGLMERRMAALTGALDPSEKVVLFGHNLHLAKSSEQLRFGPTGADSRPMWPSLGARLEASAPGSMYVLWLLYAEGTRLQGSARGCDPETPVTLRRGSLEATLDAAGERYFVAIDEAPANGLTDEDHEFGTATSYGGGVLRGAVDALVFLHEARASR